MKITLELTELELNALRLILLDRVRETDKDLTEQWEDVVTGEIVTIDHLLTRLMYVERRFIGTTEGTIRDSPEERPLLDRLGSDERQH